MATALDDTYGGSGANTYLSLADADALIRDYVDVAEAWERVQGAGNKQALALLGATRQIDAAASWHGGKYFWNQTLEFPRALQAYEVNVSVATSTANWNATLAASEYLRQQKRRVQLACALQAVYRLLEGRDLDREQQYRGIVGSSRGHKFSESSSYGRPHLVLCPEAWDQLAPYEGDPVIRRGGSTLTPGRTPPTGTLP